MTDPRAAAMLETRVLSASPEQLHLFVIDGALNAASEALPALREERFQHAFFALTEARRFVAELLSGLDGNPDSEVTRQAEMLFSLIYANLVEADQDREPKNVETAIQLLQHHRETWVALMSNPAQTAAANNEAASSSLAGREWSA